MACSLGVRQVNLLLISYSNFKSEPSALSFLLTVTNMPTLFLLMLISYPLTFSYDESIANFILCMMSDIEFHLKVSKLYLSMSLVCINVTLDPLSPTIST